MCGHTPTQMYMVHCLFSRRHQMHALTLGRTLLYAVVAGILAGLIVTLFHEIITEPVIDQAIALEEQRAAQNPTAAMDQHEAPIVSRAFQKTGGLLIGYMLYGTTWALLFTLAFFPLQSWLARFGLWRGTLLLAGLVWWAIILVPFIKYPANPLVVGAALVLLMPPNPDAVTAPAALVLNFRVRSLFGLTLFWAVFGVVFGWF